MLKKELLKTVSQPLAFLAYIKPEAGVETANFTTIATTFRDETNLPLITNQMPIAFSPFTGKTLQVIASSANVELDATDFTPEGRLVVACTCKNEKCGVDLYVPTEVAALINGEDFHCVVCATVNTAEIAAPESAEVPPVVVETPPVVAAPAVVVETPPADAAVVASDEAVVETPPVGTEEAVVAAKNKSKDEDDADDENLTDEEIDAIIDDNEKDDDDDDDDDDKDLEIILEEDDEENASLKVGEIETVETASLGTEILVDVTSKMDIRPETLALASISRDHGRLAVFAYNNASSKTEVIAYFNRDAATPEVASLFDPAKLTTLRNSAVASILSENGLDAYGMEPITATILVDDAFNDKFQAEVAAAIDTHTNGDAAFVDQFKHSMQIALAGMNKGTYLNPMIDEIASVLSHHGIQNPEHVAAKVVETAGNQYALAALEHTEELLALDDKSREAVAKTIERQSSVLAFTARKVAAPQIATAALEIPPTQVRGVEEARPVPVSKLLDFTTRGRVM